MHDGDLQVRSLAACDERVMHTSDLLYILTLCLVKLSILYPSEASDDESNASVLCKGFAWPHYIMGRGRVLVNCFSSLPETSLEPRTTGMHFHGECYPDPQAGMDLILL